MKKFIASMTLLFCLALILSFQNCSGFKSSSGPSSAAPGQAFMSVQGQTSQGSQSPEDILNTAQAQVDSIMNGPLATAPQIQSAIQSLQQLLAQLQATDTSGFSASLQQSYQLLIQQLVANISQLNTMLTAKTTPATVTLRSSICGFLVQTSEPTNHANWCGPNPQGFEDINLFASSTSNSVAIYACGSGSRDNIFVGTCPSGLPMLSLVGYISTAQLSDTVPIYACRLTGGAGPFGQISPWSYNPAFCTSTLAGYASVKYTPNN